MTPVFEQYCQYCHCSKDCILLLSFIDLVVILQVFSIYCVVVLLHSVENDMNRTDLSMKQPTLVCIVQHRKSNKSVTFQQELKHEAVRQPI